MGMMESQGDGKILLLVFLSHFEILEAIQITNNVVQFLKFATNPSRKTQQISFKSKFQFADKTNNIYNNKKTAYDPFSGECFFADFYDGFYVFFYMRDA